MRSSFFSRSAFTLIELLVVIAIIAILSVVVVLTLNPSELLKQSRDANRVSDLATINTALGIYSAQGGTTFASSSVVYLSLPDPLATSTAGDQCQGLGLSAAPSGTTYFCEASSTFRNVNGGGWIPINFTTLSAGAPFSLLPQDPVNTTSSGNYYVYSTNGSQYIITAIPESQKTKTALASSPQVLNYPEVMAQGSNLTISPLFNASGLVGYWPLEEGAGTVVLDQSGYGGNGTWSGSLINGSHYTVGKVVSFAGNFDGSTDSFSATVTNATSSIGSGNTISFWMKYNGYDEVILNLGNFNYYIGGGGGCAGINQGGGIYGAAAPAIGQWVYVTTVVYNGGTYNTNGSALYYNGALVTPTCNGSGTVVASSSLIVGVYYGGAHYTSGAVDDIRVYNRVLSASEIQALYNAEK
jgi:prepilin-type N-terminal cleavage/methylation domain-containing protein